MSRPKVLVTVLCGTERSGWVNPELSGSLIQMTHDPRFQVAVVNVKDSRPFEVARNHTIKLARDNRVDWLLSIDNDNYFLNGSPLEAIAAAGPQHSVIGLSYGTRISKTPATSFQLYPPPECRAKAEGAFSEVRAVGGGVLMVNRRVWETIPRGPWFRWQYGTDAETVETLDQSSGGCGEDVAFCLLCGQNRLRVWVHNQLIAGHFKTTDMTSLVLTLTQLSEQAKGAGAR